MKKKIKGIFIFIALFAVAFLGVFGLRTSAAASLSVTLEEQESEDGASIRYISTASNLTDLSTVTDITVYLTYAHGDRSKYATDTITTVYKSVSGENGKAEAADTYYAVYSLTDLSSYSGYTFTATFIYNLAEGGTLSTNTVSYTIPAGYTVTDGTGTFKTTGEIASATTADSVQEGVIFHAWDWSMTTIKSHLAEIKAQGFTTIQTSPMQPQKDYYASDDADAWWKMYQPLGFVIATGSNALGTKSELEDLCTAAHEMGIKIIVDVVSNHLAGSSTQLASGVAAYEPAIYGSNGTLSGGALLHSNTGNGTSDSSAYSTTTGNIGMPDLDTSNSVVQQRVLSLLKEYIDVGVDGFRFDAAKHIETPSDADGVKSDYWSVVLGGATAYAQQQRNFTPYYYGEILNTPGSGRSWSYYTGMMSITDNVTGNNCRSNINNGSASGAASSSYNTGEAAEHVVLWGESHDTYSNNECESTFVSQLVVDKAYAMAASRSGASALYFARPTDGTFGTQSNGTLTITCTTALGAMGSSHWQTDYIGAVNKFHNYWVGNSECLGSSGNFAYNVRYNSSESGMVIVNVGSSTSVSISGATNMKDGSYTDMVSGNTFNVSSGTVTGTMASSGIAVLYSNSGSGGSAYVTSSAASVFSDSTMSTTLTIANCKSATVTIDGKTSPVYNGSVVTFGSEMSYGDSKTMTVTLTDTNGNTTSTSFTYEKVAPTTVYFVNNKSWSNVYAHMWNSDTGATTTWPGTLMTDTGKTLNGYEVYSISFTTGYYDSIIFNDGADTAQTQDITLSSSYNCYTVGSSTDSEGHYSYTGSTYGCITHTYSDTLSYDDENHYYVCTACGYKDEIEAHIWNKGVVTTPAGDYTTGIKTYTCTICGATKEEVLPALIHTHTYSETVTEPTRTTAGKYTYTCVSGDDSYEVAIPATGTEYTYFENTNNWTDVCIYMWDSTGTNATPYAWASAPEMNKVSGSTNIYYYAVDLTKYDSVIFKNSSYQTVDLTLDKTGNNAYRLTGTTTTVNSTAKYNAESWSNYLYLNQCADGADTWDSGTITKAATCTSAGIKTYTCTVCGKTKTEEIAMLSHTAASTYTYDETNHYHKCTECGTAIDTEAHTLISEVTKAATTSSTGTMTYTCTVCSYSYTETIPVVTHDHVYDGYEKNSSYHWQVCTLCSTATTKTAHTYTSEITTEATITSEGVKTYTCTVCGYSYTETIPSTGHTHSYTGVVTEATCEESGYTTYTCSCGDSYVGDITDPLEHTWNSGTVTTQVTRTTAGVVTYTCETCGKTTTKEVAATGNTIYFVNNWVWGTPYVYAWNSTGNNGWPGALLTNKVGTLGTYDVYSFDVGEYTSFIYNNGGDSDKSTDTTISATICSYMMDYSDSTGKTAINANYTIMPTMCTSSHTWNSGEVVTAATASTTGTTKYTCSVCGSTKTVITPKTHTHVYATTYTWDANYHWYACTDSTCSSVNGKTAHSFTRVDRDGTYYDVCDDCDYEKAVVVEGIKLHYKISSEQMNASDDPITLFHLWSDGSYSADLTFTTYSDSFGYVVTIPYSSISDCTQLGLIIKCGVTDCWNHKDGSENKFIYFDDLTTDEDNYYNAYLVYGSDEVFATEGATDKVKITYFSIYEDSGSFFLKTAYSTAPTTWSITVDGNALVSSGTVGSDSNAVDPGSTWLYYKLGTSIPDVSADYELTCNFGGDTVTQSANMWALYDTTAFENTYCYSGTLGAIYSKTETVFKVWSPIASSMKLRLYESGTPKSLGGSDAYTDYTMTKSSNGVWEYSYSGDLSGKYYNYVVTNYKFKDQVVTDPYAKSTGINGLRGMVVDFSSTNPDGWDSIKTLAYDRNTLAVYEAHIADLTSSTTWGGTSSYAKTFLGFCETGTTYTKDGTTVTTGFDHIKELGVNAVQLLPIFDGSNDEVNPSYNWGYNPLNYNALEGAYSTNPYDGYTRIKEFKQLMYAYNQAGIEIIMDVVFNHVSDLDTSSFNYLMPGYYYRYSYANNKYYASNGSGCGSETCSEHYMMRKFMIDSTEFWATEYKIGGFRFDLMGVHDIDTMAQIASNLQTKVDANCVVYGEPWSCGCTTTATLAELANLSQFDGYGNFNSSIRDGLLGNTGASNQGWIAGEATYDGNSCVSMVQVGIQGYTYGYTNNLAYGVQYASCHDNYLIKDHLVALGWADASSIKKAAMLTNSVVLTSSGVSFFAEGEEFLRTKNNPNYSGYSIHNTYNAPYEVNALDYSLKITNADMVENYKLLTQLKTSGAFANGVAGFTTASDNNGFYYSVTGTDGSKYTIIHHNGASASYTVSVSGTVYLDTLGATEGNYVTSVTVGQFGTVVVKTA